VDFENGLVKSASGTADNKVAEIAVAAAKSIASVEALGVGPSASLSPVSGRPSGGDWKSLLKRLQTEPPEKVLGDIWKLANAPVAVLELIDVSLPIQRIYTVADLEGEFTVVDRELQVALNMSCSGEGQPVQDSGPGIAVSASRACELVVLSREDFARSPATLASSAATQARAKVWALDSRYVTFLPLDRTALVKTTTSYTFVSGRPTKSDFDRPAPALEVASLPFKVVGGFAGAFLDGIKGRSAELDARTALTKSRTAEIQAAEALAKAREDAVTAAAARKPKDVGD
jgi:hypothetical protein